MKLIWIWSRLFGGDKLRETYRSPTDPRLKKNQPHRQPHIDLTQGFATGYLLSHKHFNHDHIANEPYPYPLP